MKAVLTLSKKFFPKHISAGKDTDFKNKFLNGSKIHTCRCNYEYWKDKIEKLKEVGGVLSIRQWSDKPYKSPQEIIKDIPSDIIGVQKLTLIRYKSSFPNIKEYGYAAIVDGDIVDLEILAKNDGLSVASYESWFEPLLLNPKDDNSSTSLDFAIIHFTEFRY